MKIALKVNLKEPFTVFYGFTLGQFIHKSDYIKSNAKVINFIKNYFFLFIKGNKVVNLSFHLIKNRIKDMWESDPYNYHRRVTDEVKAGTLKIGGENPVRVQSMANTNTNDIESSTAQCLRIVEAGGELVRFTTQGLKEVENLNIIHAKIREADCHVPLVADVHFNANVADMAARYVEKVRINPGNYVSGIKTTLTSDYTEAEYQEEFEKIRTRFKAFLDICNTYGTAIRIGVNHGSLSERMLNRWGNTPDGMVESCMEFLRICREENFTDVVISMKASNTVLMIQSVRLLVETMEKENLRFPVHLGVTEAGDGEDGRIKSAAGIGGLLAEGIGDTIRVSLSEEPEAEIPVTKLLRDYITQRESHEAIRLNPEYKISPLQLSNRKSNAVKNIGGENVPVVISRPCNHQNLKADYILLDEEIQNTSGEKFGVYADKAPEVKVSELSFLELNYSRLDYKTLEYLKTNPQIVILLSTDHINPPGEQRAFIHTLIYEGCNNPVIVVGNYRENDLESLQIKAAADLGILFVDGLADGILIKNEGRIPENEILSISFGILQAARVRVSKTEFISCPGCGRTMFNLQTVVAEIKTKTSHLTGLKIGIMGCIVNGIGEMADADYGYVGAGRGKVSLYKKQTCIEKNVPESEAVEHLINLIKSYGDWKEPEL